MNRVRSENLESLSPNERRRLASALFRCAFTTILLTVTVASTVGSAGAQSEEPVFFDSSSSGDIIEGSIGLHVDDLATPLEDLVPPRGVVDVEINGDSANRVDLTFLGDGYTLSDMSKYESQVRALVDGMLSDAPFSAYRRYFNFRRVEVVSADSGVDHEKSVPSYKNTALDMEFWCYDSQGTLCGDVSKAEVYASYAPDTDQTVVLANASLSAGTAYPYSDVVLISAGAPDAGKSLVHQLGHSFGNLADEYTTGGWEHYTGFEPAEINVSLLGESDMRSRQTKWWRWLGEDTPLGKVGAYEGALGSAYRVYRPTSGSRMSSLELPFNAPSTEALIIEIYKIVAPIDSATPSSNNLTGSDTLSIVPMQPTDHALTVQWYLDGVAIPGGTGNSFRANDSRIADGPHQVSVVVRDDTPLVKDEAARARWMTDRRSWNINVNQRAPIVNADPESVSTNRGKQVKFNCSASGGDLSYKWYRDGVLIAGATSPELLVTPVRLDESGAKFWCEVSNVVGSVTSKPASMTVLNIAPVLPVFDELFIYRKNSGGFPLSLKDADGDQLLITAELMPDAEGSGASISVTSTGINVQAGPIFVGQFHGKVTVTDGFVTVAGSFPITVGNRAPSLAKIADRERPKSLTSSTDTVQISGSDADGDEITYSVAVEGEAAKVVTAQLKGTSITYSFPANYRGSCSSTVTVSDGLLSSTQTFTFTMFNQAPTISAISDQLIRRPDSTRDVPVEIKDADGDPLQISTAVTVDPDCSVPVSDKVTFFSDPSGWSYNILGLKEKHFLGKAEGSAATEQFYILPNGTIFRYARPQSADVQYLALGALGTRMYDNPNILFGAKSWNDEAPASISVGKDLLGIQLAGKFNCMFLVSLNVTDGVDVASKQFKVTVEDPSSAVAPLDDQRMHWREDLRSVAVSAVGDLRQDTLSVSARPYDNTSVRELDKKFNFFFPNALKANAAGLDERYIFGLPLDTGSLATFFILPKGELYRYDTSMAKSEFIARLPRAFYREPSLLVDLVDMSKDPISIETSDTAISLNPADRWTGKTLVEVITRIGANAAESQVIALEVYNTKPQLVVHTKEGLVMRNGFPALRVSYGDEDGPDKPKTQLSAMTGMYLDIERDLDISNQFQGELLTSRFNERGWREKYVKGALNNTTTDFFVLPNDELYRLGSTVEGSPFVAALPLGIYADPTQLSLAKKFPAPLPSSLKRVWTDGSYVYLELVGAPTWNEVFTITLTDGYDYVSEVVGLGDCTHPVELAPIKDQRIHWLTNEHRVPLEITNPDGDPLTISVTLKDSSVAYELDQAQDFTIPVKNTYDNREGYGEHFITGTKNQAGREYWYFILPSGRLYQFVGSVATSTYLGTVPSIYYSIPKLLVDVPPPTITPIKVAIEGEQVVITPVERGWLGIVPVEVSVTDFSHTALQSFAVEVFDDAPVISETNPLDVSWNSSSVSINLSPSDPNNESLALEAFAGTPAQLAWQLDKDHELVPLTGAGSFNVSGWKEKLLHGKEGLFAILPNGALYLWNTKPANSELVAVLPAQYYTDPLLLTSPAAVSAVPPLQVSLTGVTTTVTFPDDFRGPFNLYARVHDGNLYGFEELISGVRSNHAPTIKPIADQRIHWRTKSVEVATEVSDPDAEQLTISAGLYDTTALYALDQQYNFTIPATGVLFNTKGQKEKLFLGTMNPKTGSQWYAILPNGELYAYSGSFSAASRLATLPTQYYDDPTLLVDVSPASFRPAQVTLKNGVISIVPVAGWTGRFVVTAGVSDIEYSLATSFLVTVYNTDPSITKPEDVRQSRSVRAASLTLSGSDSDSADSPTLVYSARVGGYDQRLKELLDTFRFRPSSSGFRLNSLGWSEKHFIGGASVDEDFVILPTGQIRRVTGAIETAEVISALPRLYYDNPTLLFGSSALAALPAATVSVSGSQVSVGVSSGFEGVIPVLVEVFDGLAYSSQTFNVTIANYPPALGALIDQKVHWRDETISVDVSGSDPDGDALTFSIKPTCPSGITASLQGTRIGIRALNAVAASCKVDVTVSDGKASATSTFGVNITNTAPQLDMVPLQALVLGQDKTDITLRGFDKDDDPLTYSVTCTGATVTQQTTKVSIAVPKGFTGNIPCSASVTDTRESATQSFTVNVRNTAPVLNRIEGQAIHWTTTSHTVALSAHDAEAHPITFSASVVDSTVPVVPTISGSTLNLSVPAKELGGATIEVKASDGYLASRQTFRLVVTNNAPKMQELEGQLVNVGVREVTIPIVATDPDSDPLTYSAEVLPPERLAYDLDQKYNFEILYGHLFYNLLGNEEKYIQGRQSGDSQAAWYVLYPNGDLYVWRGLLSTSSFLGRLPGQYYDDPSKLVDVPDPGSVPPPATVRIDGTNLIVGLQEDWVGQFSVRASVTDTKASDSKTALIEVIDPFGDVEEEDVPSNSDECIVGVEIHEGEFTKKVKDTTFVADARLYDKASCNSKSASKSRWCGEPEVSISKLGIKPYGEGEFLTRDWTSGETLPFALLYNATSGTIDYSIGGQSVRHLMSGAEATTDLLIRLQSNADDNGVTVTDLTLNGEPVIDEFVLDGKNKTARVLQLTDGTLTKGFYLEGFVRLNSNGGKNVELNFQILGVAIAGHSSDCGELIQRKVRICHLEPGESRGQTTFVKKTDLPVHIGHGDFFGDCPGPQGLDDEMCAAGNPLKTPVYGQWNTALNMTNRLELVNREDKSTSVAMTVVSSTGATVHSGIISLEPHEQKNLSVGEIPGVIANSQGLLKLEFSGNIDGRMVYERATGAGEYEFAYAIPLTEGMFGETSVNYNTIQPSTVAKEKSNRVMNWLSITNLETTEKEFRVRTFNAKGRLISDREISVPGLVRMNIDGGHDIAGPKRNGLHVITPLDLSTEYLAELTRFGGNNSRGSVASEYRFALPFRAQLPQSDTQYVPISRKKGELSWVEVGNVLASPVMVGVNLFNNQGKLLQSVNAKVPAFGNVMIASDKYLKVGDSGYAQIVPRTERSVVAQSTTYYLSGASSGSVNAAFSSEARESSLCTLVGGFNLEDADENWLLIVNPSNAITKVIVSGVSGGQVSERVVTLKKRASIYVPVHDSRQLALDPGTSGLLRVRTMNVDAPIYSNLVRYRRSPSGSADFAVGIPIR